MENRQTNMANAMRTFCQLFVRNAPSTGQEVRRGKEGGRETLQGNKIDKERQEKGFFSPNLFAICNDTFSKWCVGKRGRVEEGSVAPLRNKRVKTV
jgi:hypothetical protein